MTKCPYVPPHEWNVDFPHLMLQAKAIHYKKGKTKRRDKLLTATDKVGQLAGIPVIAQGVNALNDNKPARKLLSKTLGIHPDARLPEFQEKRSYFSGRIHARDDRQGGGVCDLLWQSKCP